MRQQHGGGAGGGEGNIYDGVSGVVVSARIRIKLGQCGLVRQRSRDDSRKPNSVCTLASGE